MNPTAMQLEHIEAAAKATKQRTRKAFTIAETAEMLAQPASTIAHLCRIGRLRGAYKAGTGGRTSPWRIPPAAIDHYQATQPRS